MPTSLVSGVKRRHSDQDDGSDYSDYEVPGGQQAPTLQPAATTPYDFAIETWQACNCLFLEDSGMCGPVGRVVKVDGRYAAVVYNNRDRSSSSDVLASCWLLRKDDLMVRRLVGWGGRSWGRVGWDIVRLLYVDVMRNYEYVVPVQETA